MKKFIILLVALAALTSCGAVTLEPKLNDEEVFQAALAYTLQDMTTSEREYLCLSLYVMGISDYVAYIQREWLAHNAENNNELGPFYRDVAYSTLDNWELVNCR